MMNDNLNSISKMCDTVKAKASALEHKVNFFSMTGRIPSQIEKLQNLLTEANTLCEDCISIENQMETFRSDNDKKRLSGLAKYSLKGSVGVLAVARASLRNSKTKLNSSLKKLYSLHVKTHRYEAVKQRVKAPAYYKRYSGKINLSLTGMLGRVMNQDFWEKLVALQPLAKATGEASIKQFNEKFGALLYEKKRDLYIKCNSGGQKKKDEFYLQFKLALADWAPESAKRNKGHKGPKNK